LILFCAYYVDPGLEEVGKRELGDGGRTVTTDKVWGTIFRRLMSEMGKTLFVWNRLQRVPLWESPTKSPSSELDQLDLDSQFLKTSPVVGSCCCNHIAFGHLWQWDQYITTVPTAPNTSISPSHSFSSHYPHSLKSALDMRI